MDDQDASNSPAKRDEDRSTALRRVRSLARRGRRRIVGALRTRIEDASDTLREQLLQTLASPEQVAAIQQALVRLTSWTLKKGFRADPNAELLFRFVDWMEKRHGRQQITVLLLQSPLLRDPAFIDALVHLSKTISPFQSEPDEHWDLSRIDRFKERAADRLIDLLVHLAALEQEEPAPQGSLQVRVDYFEAAPIPEEFRPLARMSLGENLLQREAAPNRFVKLLSRGRNETGEESALTRFIPGLGDETLHFLVLSTTFFLQSYLLRNLVEALPDIAEELTKTYRHNDTIDINVDSD